MRLKRVLIALAKSNSPLTEGLFFKLMGSDPYRTERARLKALIEAMPYIKDPSPRVLGIVERNVEALANIATLESCARIEERLLSDNESISGKIQILQANLLSRRNDPEIVDLYGRLIKVEVPDPKFRNMIVQSLFDYRPKEWWRAGSSDFRQPPWRGYASVSVLKKLLAISQDALKQDLRPETKEGVLNAQEEIKKLLAGQNGKDDEPVPVPEPAPKPRSDKGSADAGSSWMALAPIVAATAFGVLALAGVTLLLRRRG